MKEIVLAATLSGALGYALKPLPKGHILKASYCRVTQDGSLEVITDLQHGFTLVSEGRFLAERCSATDPTGKVLARDCEP